MATAHLWCNCNALELPIKDKGDELHPSHILTFFPCEQIICSINCIFNDSCQTGHLGCSFWLKSILTKMETNFNYWLGPRIEVQDLRWADMDGLTNNARGRARKFSKSWAVYGRRLNHSVFRVMNFFSLYRSIFSVVSWRT